MSRMMDLPMIASLRNLGCILVVCVTMVCLSVHANEVLYSHAKLTPSQDKTNVYPIELLRVALSKVHKRYKLIRIKTPMPQSRAFRLLASGESIDIVWSMTSIEREQAYRPIRIPIHKGLFGLRLPLILSRSQSKFDASTGLDQLSSLVAGQGHDWPDTIILADAGFSVVSSSTYGGLIGMLEKGRIDFFPRSIVEIWGELNGQANLDIVVERTTALVYPTAIYYFVRKENTTLYEDVQRGLRASIEDGSFEILFNDFHLPLIQKANLAERRFFKLNNPLLPAETPLEDPKLWFSIDAYLKKTQ